MRGFRPNGRVAPHLLALLLFLLTGYGPAESAPPVRVRILADVSAISIGAKETIRLYAVETQRILAEWPPAPGVPAGTRAERKRRLPPSPDPGGGSERIGDLRGAAPPPAREVRFTRKRGRFHWGGRSSYPGPLRLRALGGPIDLGGRPYRGLVDLVPVSPQSFRVINELDLESYLRGVLALEMGPRWPLEALKAQAVAARTYVLWKKRTARSGGQGSHLGADALDQVYGGVAGESPATDAAVAATRGQVLTYGGEFARTYFHAMSDGWTEEASSVFGGEPISYLRPVSSPYDRGAPGFRWEASIGAEEIEGRLARNGVSVGRLEEVVPMGHTPSGRVASVRLVGSERSRTLPARTLRSILGWGVVRSAKFAVRREGRFFRFAGRGRGHGVGMSQWGARFLAERGWGYEAILRHYYPGTALRRLGGP